MACILKAPTRTGKGIVTFTTQERDQLIKNDLTLRNAITALKDQWVVGLHHNWHDHEFHYDAIFDFSMAGPEDLREVDGRAVPLLPMDACNFAPAVFRPAAAEPYWDLLYVARAVYFKGIPEFFQCVRRLFDEGDRLRVLFVCPIPPYSRKDRQTHLYNIRERYDELFTDAEKNRFTLLATEHRYPFPFDLETLAFFYRSCRVFAHFAPEERRSRVAGYAWASGLPVVGMPPVGSLLPPGLRKPPFFFEAPSYDAFPDLIRRALREPRGPTARWEPVRKVVAAPHTQPALRRRLSDLMKGQGRPWDGKGLALVNLDIRLGRHHELGSGPNTVEMPLHDFVDALRNRLDDVRRLINAADPELALAGTPAASAPRVPERRLRATP